MRSVIAPVLLMAAALTANAQGFVRRVDGPQLTIRSVGWTTPPTNNSKTPTASKSPRVGESIHPSYRATDSSRVLDWRSMPLDAISYIPLPPPPESVSKRKRGLVNFGFDVENQGFKRILAIDWTMVFTNKSQETKYHRLSFHSKVETLQGKTLTLSIKTPFDKNWERLQADLESRNALVVIVIISIEYADGSKWQRP